MNHLNLFLLALATTTGIACGVGCNRPALDSETASQPKAKSAMRTVSVDVLTASKTVMPRTTTQPATVHAFYEAEIFARTAGYLDTLNADIGMTVPEDHVLAVIDVPEMAQRRKAQLATIRRMEAEQRRADSQWAVAKARTASHEAKRDKAQAEVGKAEAELTAALVERDRVADLVERNAAADQLLDEAKKKHEAAEAEKTAAEAAVASAKAELDLAGALMEAAVAEVDVAKATTDVARRELDELDELIKYATLRAPFAGVVTQRNVDPGDLVRNVDTRSNSDEKPLFVVTKLDKVRIRVHVPERDAPLATEKDPVEITLQALPGEVFQAEISRVAGVLDEKTRTMLVEIDLPNPEGHLRPGMFGQAVITLVTPGDTLTLPAGAVRFDGKGASYVYVVNDSDEVEVTDVETGMDDGHRIEITAGLSGEERVVGPLLRRLKNGQKVHVRG